MSNETTEQFERLPHVIGRYLLVERLGAGGMGAVYHALQLTRLSGVERFCVVKVALPRLAANRAIVNRFVHEARTSILLHHRNLCTTYDVDADDDRVLISMESIAGCDVRTISKGARSGAPSLTNEEAVALVVDALEGVDYAHSFVDPRTGEPLLLVHRDISPHNLMVSWAGEVKVIDFGIALSELRTEITGVGLVLGKVRYMAPEQADGGSVDRRADVFCMGLVLAELLSGERFWGTAQDGEILAALRSGAPLRSSSLSLIAPELRAVVERALAPNPRSRFGSAGAFRDALKAALPVQDTQAILRRALARLFPGKEAEQREHLQDLYRLANVTARARDASWQDEAPTHRNFGLPDPAHLPAPREPAAALLADAPTRETPVDDTLRVARPANPASSTAMGVRPNDATVISRRDLTTENPAADSNSVTLEATIRQSPAPSEVAAPRSAAAPSMRGLVAAGLGAAALAAFVALAWSATQAPALGDAGVSPVAPSDASVVRAVDPAPDAGHASSDGGPPAAVALATPTDAGPLTAVDAQVADAGTNEDARAKTTLEVDAGSNANERPADSTRKRIGKKRTPPPTPTARTLPPRPQRLGDRLRYLNEHCAKLTCTARLNAKPLAALAPDEIRKLSDDASDCLDTCGAR